MAQRATHISSRAGAIPKDSGGMFPAEEAVRGLEATIKVRSTANGWIFKAFPFHRAHLVHGKPRFSLENAFNLGCSARLVHFDARSVQRTSPVRVQRGARDTEASNGTT